MPKSANQRGKLLVLLRILQRETDEEHLLSASALIDRLAAHGISAERKSIYEGVDTLRSLGYDIVLRRGKGYYLGARDFELPELKLLVDAVQSSKFITRRKCDVLISRLSAQTSVYEARTLQRQLYVAGRTRSMNEQVYYSIDAIYEAINANCQISFSYFDYNMNREKVFRHNHKRYQVSPFALMRDNDNYYLVAYDSAWEKLRHYRVDKMDQLSVTDFPREGETVFAAAEPSTYADHHFGMFQGEEQVVLLRCQSWMAHILIDRFGDNVMMAYETPDTFTATVHVAVSPQFFSWLFGLSGGAIILGPPEVKTMMEAQLRQQLRAYCPSFENDS